MQAQTAWERYLMRNRSIVVDLFQGQLRSEVRACVRVCAPLLRRVSPRVALRSFLARTPGRVSEVY